MTERNLNEGQNPHVASLAQFSDEIPDPVLRVSSDGCLRYANPAARKAFGDLLLDAERQLPKLFGDSIRQVLDKGCQTRREITYGQRTYLMTFSPARSNVNVHGQDISERKRAEEEIAVLTRLHTVLSHVNEAIVRTRDEDSLFRQICQIVAEQGDYALVWLGLVEGRQVRPVASSSSGFDYVQNLCVEVDGELGQGPTGTCVREGRAVVNDDFDSNPATGPWRGVALDHGFRSSAAFPLYRHGKVIGALTLYATRPGAFDLDHIKLLDSLCADVSYALDALEQERIRTEVEQALRESEKSLREADRQRNAFLAVLSHELRNPLAPLQNGVYILERATPGSTQAHRALAVISRQVRQLTRLVDDLLDVTRITRNKLRLQRAEFDLALLVSRVIEDHKGRFVNAGITFENHTNVSPLWIDGDEQRLAQVVGNLLINAAKFTTQGGRVALELDADEPNKNAVIRVQDTGVGISAEMLPRLFEAFIQADESLDRSEAGLGLGLAIVKAVVDMHGGLVEAHSAGPGKGAEFVVRLPIHRGQPAQQQVRTPSNPPPPRRVLVIEDNEDAADSLREALELSNHKVEVAYDGPEGLMKAREFNPDIVLCDIGLPGMNGFDVAKAFRNDHVLRTTYLVALTGYARPEDQRRAAEAGFDCHLPKPHRLQDIEELFIKLDEQFEGGVNGSASNRLSATP